MITEVSDEMMREALDHIARTPDGELLYRYFQKVLCSIANDESALPAHNGRRRFAAELMGLMAKGIRESGRHADASVTFSLAGPRAVARTRGAGRRVTLDTPVAGYDAPSPGND